MESVNLKALTKTEIFAGATEEEVSSMLNCEEEEIPER